MIITTKHGYTEIETPFDSQLAHTEAMRDCIKKIMGNVRGVINEYGKLYDVPKNVSDALLGAEEGFDAAFDEGICKLEREQLSYNPMWRETNMEDA